MAGTWRLMAGMLAVFAVTAGANAGCWWYGPAVAYYYPPVYYYYPRILAVPDAAPASKSDDRPRIVATRGSSASPAGERVKVGFWNLTGRDIMLTVDGKARMLAKNRTVTLDLARAFTWQVDNSSVRSDRVADGMSAHEVVIRD